jgi:hypothetical protein
LRGDASAVSKLSLPGFESLLTDTLQITTLTGSERINVVAGEARAGVDLRLLPDTDEQELVAEIARTLGPGLTVNVRLTSPAAPPSPADSAIFRTAALPLTLPMGDDRGALTLEPFRCPARSSRSGLHRGLHRFALLSRPRNRSVRFPSPTARCCAPSMRRTSASCSPCSTAVSRR